MEKHELKALLNEVLDERRSIDEDTHANDHAFIRLLKEREKRRIERIEKARQHAIGWGVVTALSGLGYSIWQSFLTLFKTHGGND